MAEKEITAVVKIQIPAGQASPAPPVGTALGPHGIAIMDFCKEYNAKTEDKRGQVVPVEITILSDHDSRISKDKLGSSVIFATKEAYSNASEKITEKTSSNFIFSKIYNKSN